MAKSYNRLERVIELEAKQGYRDEAIHNFRRFCDLASVRYPAECARARELIAELGGGSSAP